MIAKLNNPLIFYISIDLNIFSLGKPWEFTKAKFALNKHKDSYEQSENTTDFYILCYQTMS